MPEPDRRSHRDGREQLVVERDGRHRDEDDEHAEEPSAQPEHDRVDGAEDGAGLASEPAAPAHPAGHPHERQDHEDRQADHRSREALRQRGLGDVRREVDAHRLEERVVHPAAGEVRGDQPCAGLGLRGPERPGMAHRGDDDLLAVGQGGEKLLRRVLRRRGEVELAADEQRLDVRRPHALVLARRRARPGVDELPAEPVEIGAGVAEDRPAIAGREVALRRPVVARGHGRHLAPDERLRECQLGEQRLEPEAAGVAVVRRDPGVERHRSRERSSAASSVVSKSP